MDIEIYDVMNSQLGQERIVARTPSKISHRMVSLFAFFACSVASYLSIRSMKPKTFLNNDDKGEINQIKLVGFSILVGILSSIIVFLVSKK